jgi:hypothetical protein
MTFFVAISEKSSQSLNSFQALRDEKNRRFVSWQCKGEVS